MESVRNAGLGWMESELEDVMAKNQRALSKTKISFIQTMPFIIGTLLLISLFNNAVNKQAIIRIFSGNAFADSFIGSSIGSIMSGNPLISYIIGGELLKSGVGLIPIVAFLTAWVTVGIVQLPAECMILGKKFAITRNSFSFISAIAIAVLTYFILRVL
jgi:uncharacterized membrane protein YraQ (UPF0718 family)